MKLEQHRVHHSERAAGLILSVQLSLSYRRRLRLKYLCDGHRRVYCFFVSVVGMLSLMELQHKHF